MSQPTEYPQAHDPHHLRQVKEALLTLWRELPPEHQATMLMVLLREGLDGEMGDRSSSLSPAVGHGMPASLTGRTASLAL